MRPVIFKKNKKVLGKSNESRGEIKNGFKPAKYILLAIANNPNRANLNKNKK